MQITPATRRCAERSEEAIQTSLLALDCFAALAITASACRIVLCCRPAFQPGPIRRDHGLDTLAADLRNNDRRWVWAPAFAGATLCWNQLNGRPRRRRPYFAGS